MDFRLNSFAGLLILIIAAGAPLAHADKGTVTHLSGVLSAKKPDGTIRVLAERSEVATGDVLTSERNTYANIRFSDGTQMTMKPASSVKLDKFAFQQDKPQEDSFAISLLTGGLRLVTGLVGARNRAKFEVKTNTATIGIRGTTFNIDDCADASARRALATNPASMSALPTARSRSRTRKEVSWYAQARSAA
jgi:hypothetical protein